MVIYFELNAGYKYNEMWALLSMKQQKNTNCSCLETIWGLSFFLCQNNNVRIVEEVALLLFFFQYLTGKQFFCMSFVSHKKHMVKKGEVIFFPTDHPESPCFIHNWWENTGILSSTWIKEGFKKGIYYQTTQPSSTWIKEGFRKGIYHQTN